MRGAHRQVDRAPASKASGKEQNGSASSSSMKLPVERSCCLLCVGDPDSTCCTTPFGLLVAVSTLAARASWLSKAMAHPAQLTMNQRFQVSTLFLGVNARESLLKSMCTCDVYSLRELQRVCLQL